MGASHDLRGDSMNCVPRSLPWRESFGLRVADSHTGNHREDDFTPLETIRRFPSIIWEKIPFELEGEVFEPERRSLCAISTFFRHLGQLRRAVLRGSLVVSARRCEYVPQLGNLLLCYIAWPVASQLSDFVRYTSILQEDTSGNWKLPKSYPDHYHMCKLSNDHDCLLPTSLECGMRLGLYHRPSLTHVAAFHASGMGIDHAVPRTAVRCRSRLIEAVEKDSLVYRCGLVSAMISLASSSCQKPRKKCCVYRK
ncbi:hypothetical protein Tco_0779043 [Tanacetum coccineum]